MGWPSLLVLVRHGESQGNVLDRDQRASLDVPTYGYPLTVKGIWQAQKAGEAIREKYGTFDIYYTSYYERAKQTMNVMFPEAKVYEDPRLAEAQRGIFHTMTMHQVEAKYPEEIARKNREGLYHYRPPGGENWPDIELRIHSFLGTLARDYANQKVLIVVHGHWLLLLQRLLEHFSIQEAMDRYEKSICPNCHVTAYQQCRVDAYSDRFTKVERLLKVEEFTPWQSEEAHVFNLA